LGSRLRGKVGSRRVTGSSKGRKNGPIEEKNPAPKNFWGGVRGKGVMGNTWDRRYNKKNRSIGGRKLGGDRKRSYSSIHPEKEGKMRVGKKEDSGTALCGPRKGRCIGGKGKFRGGDNCFSVGVQRRSPSRKQKKTELDINQFGGV